ncbi:unnamed protein product [Periconia digitata]|uniref:Uncharacterized protein n=1 Tax=Periconia digitata TaxID=1303443 RepID=A0A9W4XQA9_9PLEO|nr:unnamed protein product [Periconia digitata]
MASAPRGGTTSGRNSTLTPLRTSEYSVLESARKLTSVAMLAVSRSCSPLSGDQTGLCGFAENVALHARSMADALSNSIDESSTEAQDQLGTLRPGMFLGLRHCVLLFGYQRSPRVLQVHCPAM